MAGIYNSIFVLTPTCMDNVYVLSIWNTPSWAECKSETYVMPCGSHNHWVGKIAPVLVALWVSHDRSWASLSVFIFVMWERSPGWRHLVSQSSGQAFPFKVPRLLSASSPGFRDRWLWNKTTNLTDHSPHISLLGMMSTQNEQTWHTWKMGDAALSSCFTGGKCCPGLDHFKLSLSFRRWHWGAQLAA